MKKNKHIPAHFGTNAARQAQTRYLRGKTPESERVEKNREAAGHVISLCFMAALHDRHGIGKDRLERVIEAANGALERFAVNKRGVGMARAKRKLDEELDGLLTVDFVLPASKAPKSRRDWALLGERREAAEIVGKCYVLGTRQALGFGVERLNETVRATEDVFRQFNEWAEGGDWYGYNMLARRMTDILGEPVDVDESGADEPIFGKTLD